MVSIKKLFKSVVNKVLPKVVRYYLRKERPYSYGGINIKVYPGVFHPGLFFSTGIMLKYIKSLNLNEKSIIEIGCGTGLISVFAAKNGADVTAIDINPDAVENTIENMKLNNVNGKVLNSDLFNSLPLSLFDFVFINPPFFKRNPNSYEDYAWYCGSELQYFYRLFDSIKQYTNNTTTVYIVISEEAPIDKIFQISEQNGYVHEIVFRDTRFFEEYFLYKIRIQDDK